MIISRNHVIESDSAAIQAWVLAEEIAGRLNRAVAARGRASIAFSGGSTPAAMLEQLARQSVDWARVDVTLVDERCVPVSNARSNAGMLQKAFIDKLDAAPEFMPLFVPGESDAGRETRLGEWVLPFDIVHLGMGGDAHTASFFPDADNIGDMLDLEQPRRWLTTESASSGEQRITWSLPVLLQSRCFVLQLIGDSKLAVLERALEALNGSKLNETVRRQLPIAAFLAETELKKPDGVPGYIYYASE